MTRGHFLAICAGAAGAQALPLGALTYTIPEAMNEHKRFDVIIVGGSYAGLATGMALGRALRRVLIVDSGLPCNRQTPYSHNFITQDGAPPQEIVALARQQVARYGTVELMNGTVTEVMRAAQGFDVQVDSLVFSATKLVFATGIRDVLPDIPGLAACWGISVLHCPYCHGYEVRDEVTGVLGNGERGFELARLISNWTKDLTLFTNGPSTLSAEQVTKLDEHHIRVVESAIAELEHVEGQIEQVHFKDGKAAAIKALYSLTAFEQHCSIPQRLGCELTQEGYIQVDPQQRTNLHGVYTCGDATTRLRTVANAVAMGTTAGMMVNKELIAEEF